MLQQLSNPSANHMRSFLIPWSQIARPVESIRGISLWIFLQKLIWSCLTSPKDFEVSDFLFWDVHTIRSQPVTIFFHSFICKIDATFSAWKYSREFYGFFFETHDPLLSIRPLYSLPKRIVNPLNEPLKPFIFILLKIKLRLSPLRYPSIKSSRYTV